MDKISDELLKETLDEEVRLDDKSSVSLSFGGRFDDQPIVLKNNF